MTAFRPSDATQVGEVVAWATAEEQPIEIIGGGSKRSIGRPMQVEHVLDVSALSGIREYEAAELVLTAAAATPIAEIEAALDSQRQVMNFEPADWRGLLGTEASQPTIGGVLSCNLSGPRRIRAGAARDFFLGFHGVNGRGEQYKAGGKVVKNVTGYDLCKLVAGAYGTLGVLTEVTVRVGPKPETGRTILVLGLDDASAIRALTVALNGPHEVSGAAHVPGDVARRSAVSAIAGAGRAVTALRIEGPEPSVAFRGQVLIEVMNPFGPTGTLDAGDTAAFWRELRDATSLAEPRERAVWRISVTPSSGPAVAAAIAARAEAEFYFDWGGGLIWAAVGGQSDGGAEIVRAAVAAHGGGHGTLLRADKGIRAAVNVFQPLPEPLAALTARVKTSFDPHRVLNPGRMYAGI
ncbi:MAG TPA: glycolate oxidase subunit GlcE [Acetobacteraceae bacterium]|nr:glycolate oxidase subunit GlcE [Acetobacteraceae bacterium]